MKWQISPLHFRREYTNSYLKKAQHANDIYDISSFVTQYYHSSVLLQMVPVFFISVTRIRLRLYDVTWGNCDKASVTIRLRQQILIRRTAAVKEVAKLEWKQE
jgi:hypothetical protein